MNILLLTCVLNFALHHSVCFNGVYDKITDHVLADNFTMYKNL